MKSIEVHVPAQQLAHWAENEVQGLKIQGRCNAKAVIARIDRGIRVVRAAAARLSPLSDRSAPLPQAAEWLLDNRYLLEREGIEAAAQLKHVKRLPACGGIPALFVLMQALVRSGKGEITQSRIEAFLRGVQRQKPLMEQELWLLVPMLKAALLGYAAEGCRLLSEVKVDKEPEAWQAASARLSAAVTGLRYLSVTDLSPLLRQSSVMESMLQQDPAGLYAKMDEESRGRYRQTLSRLAARHKHTEVWAAERVLSLCRNNMDTRRRHVGYYILNKPLGRMRKTGPARAYFPALLLLTMLLLSAVGLLGMRWWPVVLLALPVAELAKNLVDAITLRGSKPRVTPRLELAGGLPEDCATLCVVSVLLTDTKGTKELLEKLENYYHVSRDAQVRFGLLADLPDAKVAKKGGDKRILECAQQGIHALNQKYGGGFYLFLRERRFNVRDKQFMGWERKRGALLELAALLRGKPTGLYAATGDEESLRAVQYVITLDADTQLTPDAVRAMVGTAAHPLNAPVIDPKRRIVTEGYGLWLPRMTVDLESANRSLFSRIYAGQGGLDPYNGVAGELYYDLFGEAIFTGKGIFHVDTFLTVLLERFPQNRILSHDLLEGSYLRAGLIGDLELIDGYPQKTVAYFDRLHRWTRGDWQIAAWLGGHVPTQKGAERNPIGALSRWKIADNLRRSLTPVFELAALTAALVLPGSAAAATAGVTVLLCLLSNLLMAALDLALRGGAQREKHHSTIITGLPAVLAQTALQFLFLPYYAFISVSGMATALWRVHVSKRNLLRWVTAAQSERFSHSYIAVFRKMFPSVVWGNLTAVLSALPWGWACGLLWFAAPLMAMRISRVEDSPRELRDGDRAFLSRQAALMWRYFEDLLTPEDHFLPPDNWQEQPAAGVAHRTSPTNIGLALLCCQTAVDLNLCPRERAYHLIDRILTTVEGLPKWHGHLLNWTDTRTLEPLYPRCVSTVDSGNLVGYLIALAAALQGDEAARPLAERAQALADATDFLPLYDRERMLFSICFDLEKDRLSDGYYDLLCSEARQTSYITIARGEIHRKSWQRLGRSLVSDEGYRGMASWTGTMFEYFMPHLLLPVPKNSLLYESLRFAIRLQIRCGQRYDIPWGISESCFYAFDPALNYQYKAHGVPGLAFKRGLGKEHVISPYSSFLSLLLEPNESIRNLRRLAALGLEGRYGLYEAADYTPGRLTGGHTFETVRCFMAHHIGMSLVAVDNALRDNIWQSRFMEHPSMRAYGSLLQERAPAGVKAMRRLGREVPDKPRRVAADGLRRVVEAPDPEKPVCHLLSNTAYTVLCTDGGLTRSACNGAALTRWEPGDPFGAPQALLRFGEESYYLSAAMEPEFSREFQAVLESGQALWRRTTRSFTAEWSVSVPANENAELRTLSVTNLSEAPLKGWFCFAMEPVLQGHEDYSAHPAFSKLFIQAEAISMGALLKRRARDGGKTRYLACCCDDDAALFDTSREEALGRGGLAALPGAAERGDSGSGGTVLDPCVLVRLPLLIPPGETRTLRLAMAYATSGDDAVQAAARCVRLSELPQTGRIDGAARLLSMSGSDTLAALELLSGMVFPRRAAEPEQRDGRRLGQSGLWKFGLSGDLPVMTCKALDPAAAEHIPEVLRKHRLLQLCGYTCDLLLLSRDGGDYRQPVRNVVMETLKAIGGEGSLGARGGVHVVDISALPPEEEALLRAIGDVEACGTAPLPPYFFPKAQPLPTRVVTVSPECRYGADGSVSFTLTNGQLPPLSWSHVLGNGMVGCLLHEYGPGLSWRWNARENPLTRWHNDPLNIQPSEIIRLHGGALDCSLFTAPDGMDTTVTYGFGWARWEKACGSARLRTTAFVPPKHMAKVMIIELEGAGNAELLYESELLLGGREERRRFITVGRDSSGQIIAEQPYQGAFGRQTYHIMASVPPRDVTVRGGTVAARLSPVRCGGKLRWVLVTGCSVNAAGARWIGALADDRSAERLLEETRTHWAQRVCPERADSGDPAMDAYLNGWALYQVIACRVLSRASQYQCGGAYGFRDQLQDVCAVMQAEPRLAYTQILRACAHQYEEGDVQHWWHPEPRVPGLGDKGVRTHCSDDLLWLPYTVSHWLEQGGDAALLRVSVPFILSAPLGAGQHDRYERPPRSSGRASVYEHCVRAADVFLRRGTGVHGLPLMGNGDWNDGFDKVGGQGQGESVWLAWFGAHVLRRFADCCHGMGDERHAEQYREHSRRLVKAGLAAWDGEWFRRGYYHNGATLGSHSDEECRIDSIAQSFAALFAGELPEEYVSKALDSAWEWLVDEEQGIVKLFTPPFDNGSANPGYIKGYVPGVRENGGQYTHAAIWLAMGFIENGQPERGEAILRMLLPTAHDGAVYKAEPYVLAADVYGAPPHIGRGGWSWYTGAAGWFYRIAMSRWGTEGRARIESKKKNGGA